jgi:hypothetical protein
VRNGKQLASNSKDTQMTALLFGAEYSETTLMEENRKPVGKLPVFFPCDANFASTAFSEVQRGLGPTPMSD